MVIKKDGSRVAFDAQKILGGIQAACGKRPVSAQQKLEIVREVEERVHREFDREVPSREIGQLVGRHLRNTDEITFVRYTSEHESFESLDDVAEAIEEYRSAPPPVAGQNDLFPAD